MLAISGFLLYLIGVPALLLPPLAFMVGGALAGARLEEDSKGVVRLAVAFAIVGISAQAFSLVTHFPRSETVLSRGGGAFLVGFLLAGLVAGVGRESLKLTAAAVLAFELGGIVGATAAVLARTSAHWSSLNSAAVGATLGLLIAGAFMSWFADPHRTATPGVSDTRDV